MSGEFYLRSSNKKGAMQVPILENMLHVPVAVLLIGVGYISAVQVKTSVEPLVKPYLPNISSVIDNGCKAEQKEKMAKVT